MLLYKIMEIYNMLIKLPIIFIRKKKWSKDIYIYIGWNEDYVILFYWQNLQTIFPPYFEP